MIMISYKEMIQLKISQRKRNIGHSLGGFQMQNFHCLLPWSNDPLTSQYWYLAICMDSCQPGTITWALVFRVLLVLHFHRHNWLITHMAELSLQINWYHGTQSSHPESHGCSFWCGQLGPSTKTFIFVMT